VNAIKKARYFSWEFISDVNLVNISSSDAAGSGSCAGSTMASGGTVSGDNTVGDVADGANNKDHLTSRKDFQLSGLAVSDDPFGKSERCPMCGEHKRKFYCGDCVRGASFCGSNHESCADKQLRLMHMQELRDKVARDCGVLLEKRNRADYIKTRIRQHKENIRLCQEALSEKRKKQDENNKRLSNLIEMNDKCRKTLPKYLDHLSNSSCTIEVKIQKIEQKGSDLNEKLEKVKKLRRLRIGQLMKFIFPISSIIQPRTTSSFDTDLAETEIVNEIAEATHTTYIRDRWVYTDSSGELKYCIVGPLLPGSGNYSAYNDSVIQNKNLIHGNTDSSKLSLAENSAFTISAGLTYTAELLDVIAFYLDIRLPYKMAYSDFCSSDMAEDRFARRVARLNANVLHLCFTQNVPLHLIQPAATIHNIIQLIDPTNVNLGRSGPLEVDAGTCRALENQLGDDLALGEDSDSESGEVFSYDSWEAVPDVKCPEVGAGPISVQSTAQTTSTMQAQSTSIATDIYNGIASIWRGFTNR